MAARRDDFVSSFSRRGSCSEVEGTLSCDLGDLRKHRRAKIRVVVMPTATGFITNIAEVTANEADPDVTNNLATETTTVTGGDDDDDDDDRVPRQWHRR
jgi:hypothetical protein